MQCNSTRTDEPRQATLSRLAAELVELAVLGVVGALEEVFALQVAVFAVPSEVRGDRRVLGRDMSARHKKELSESRKTR